MTSSGINYRDTFFEFPDLTKIQGEPDSESLYKIRNELRANAKSVYSNLSDGAHGHLALLMTAPQYALVTNTVFTRPIHPGQLVIPVGTTGPQAQVLRDHYKEQLRLFREVEGVEKALIQQIIKSVEAPYLAAIRDRVSNSLTGTVQQILEYLQTAYGRVSPQKLEDREAELRAMTYNPRLPIDIVFNAVEDFVDFATIGNQPMTQKQTIAKAYLIINKTRRFKQAITEWNRLIETNKTWIGFKDHFRQAHQEFRETTDTTLEDSELQRNNANLVQQVVDGLQAVMTPEDTNDPSLELIQQMANSANQTSETQQHLLSQIAQMQQAMQQLQRQASQTPLPFQHFQQQHQPYFPQNHYQQQYFGGGGRGDGRGRGRGRGDGRGRGGRGDPAFRRQRNTSLYCWTHGGCGHTSVTCLNKVTGHQDAATFQNKMGGSATNCNGT